MRKIYILSLFFFTLVLLAGCRGIDQPSVSNTKKQNQSSQPPSISSDVNKEKKELEQDLKTEERFVQQFLESYTNYSSLNAQKGAIKRFLTTELKDKLSVEQLSPPDLNRVTSRGEHLSIWRSGKRNWLGLITITINDQISNVQVFVLGVENQGGHYLINQFESPLQE